MLTRITINNFKKLESISFPLSESVVIIGPNNSGKSTVFQALCLWEIGVKAYIAAYQKGDLNKQKSSVTINRKDLVNSPIPDARFLWNRQKVTGQSGIPITVEIEGNHPEPWNCKAEFYFSNSESFSCKVVSGLEQITALFESGHEVRFSFLQPMSGISTTEDKLTQGSIDRKLGEGKTAEVLRNICYDILYPESEPEYQLSIDEKWQMLYTIIRSMFGVNLQKPELIKALGLISFEYIEDDIRYDISSGGRGFLQTLLLFSYMLAKPGTILLLDEPDAHLEVIRQREIFQQICRFANKLNTQVFIASHSEIVLDEAAESSKVVALIENQVVELNDATSKKSSVRRALTDIGWEKYYLARSKGHVLYMEGSTDLQMMLCFANKLQHRVEPLLRMANVTYMANNVPNTAISNYMALKEVFPELKGLAIFDCIPNLVANPKLEIICWERRELENYFARPALLIKHAQLLAHRYPEFQASGLKSAMEQSISEYTTPAYLKDLDNDWWNTAKLTDDWLDVILNDFYKRIGLPQNFYKRDYYQLISLMEKENIPIEITEKLDVIYKLLT